MRNIYIITCICIYLFVSNNLALGFSHEHMAGVLTYSFAHASALHLFINMLCVYIMYKPIHNMYSKSFGVISSCGFFCIIFTAAVVAALPSAAALPTVGGSGLVWVMLGMLLLLNPTMGQLRSYIYVAIAFVIQIIFGSSNVRLHAYAFIAGALIIIIRKAYDHIRVQGKE